jgi:AIPR protein
VIIQAKYFAQGKGASLKDIQHFQSIFQRLRNPNMSKNTRLADRVAEIDFATDNFILKFVCLGKIEGQALEQTKQELDFPAELASLRERVSIDYLDERALNAELRAALSQDSGIPEKLEIVAAGKRGDRSAIVEFQSGNHPSFILVVEGMQIVELYKKAKDTLFTLNIRNYIGNTATNKQIILTARKEPKEFFHFNNGISALAREVRILEPGDRIETNGLQIINGAQTVKALARAAIEGMLSAELKVLLRITEIRQGYGPDANFAQQITRFNNTQNVIKVSDFRSNDPVQNDLRRKFDYARFGKKVEYLPKRTDKRKSGSIPIRLEEFAKVVYSFLFDPISFSGSTSYLFDESGGYAKVFGDGTNVWDSAMPTDEFKLRSGIWWLAAEFSPALKKHKSTLQDKVSMAALERKWFLIYTARLVLQQAKGEDDYKKTLIANWNGNWKLGEGDVGQFFDRLFIVSIQAVIYVYKQAAKRPDFIHRNWMRSNETPTDLKEYVSSSPLLRI